jgi:MFS family permease
VWLITNLSLTKKSFGVFLAYYLSHDLFTGTSSFEYGFIGGLSMSCALLVAPLATAVMGGLGTRATRNIGALFQFASLIGASFATRIWHLFLSQALCFGLGIVFLFVGTSGIPAQWFRRKRSLANGITAAGSGFGGLIYSLITSAMLESIGLQWTFRALAIICLTMIVLAANLLRDRNKAVGSQHRSFKAFKFRQPKFELFRHLGFFSMLGYVALIFTLADFSQASGLSAHQGSITSAMLNLGQCIGRPLTGWISMRLGRMNIAAAFTFLTGFLCLVMWTQTKNAAGIYSFAILAGMVGGTFWATVYAVLVDIVGISDLPSSLSLTWVILFIPCTVAEPIALSLRDSLKRHAPYLPVQLFTGFMYVAAAMSLLVVRFWTNISQSQKTQPDSSNDQLADNTSTPAHQSRKAVGTIDQVQGVGQDENRHQEVVHR